ncbi:hypothetical protein SORBI_3001G179500 [Sorghum bicolor]|uniref:F-box domain-containing protein n=1 Tax=Sorghum bicolor TaxID=4558 RepID=C5WU66_SORBI|nr:hypothetical protein SORBI_3001G179500 [Sorghum bicolor]
MPTTTAAAITLIPDDVLADVLRLLGSPSGLAACRSVCRAWRAVIDDRRLLRADLLPLSLSGLLLCLNVEGEPEPPELLARPGAGVTGYLMPRRSVWIQDHCNGLILVGNDVLNPATGRVVRLPKCPPSPFWGDPRCFSEHRYLAFDPAESPHFYQVFCIPMVLTNSEGPGAAYRAIAQCEWPPSPFVLSVFSSMTGRWEARSLVRQGGAAGKVDDMVVPLSYDNLHSACWRGALYVHCQNDFVMRISLSDHTTTYQVIKPPREVEECRDPLCGRGRLGRSEKGVYFASFDREMHLCVWILHDGGGHMEWIPRHRSAYGLAMPSSPRSSWTLHNALRSEDANVDAQEWDSDDDAAETTLHAETEDRIQEQLLVDYEILALHPYREIIFMFKEAQGREVAYAYHLKSSKLEDLGKLFPKDGTPGCFTLMENSFPYTPCRMGAP